MSNPEDQRVHIWATDDAGESFEWVGWPGDWAAYAEREGATVDAFAVCVPEQAEPDDDDGDKPTYGPVITVKPKG